MGRSDLSDETRERGEDWGDRGCLPALSCSDRSDPEADENS